MTRKLIISLQVDQGILEALRRRDEILFPAIGRGAEKDQKDPNSHKKLTPLNQIPNIFSRRPRTKFFITSIILIRCEFPPAEMSQARSMRSGAIRPGDNEILSHLTA
jgi:hypothetical protein